MLKNVGTDQQIHAAGYSIKTCHSLNSLNWCLFACLNEVGSTCKFKRNKLSSVATNVSDDKTTLGCLKKGFKEL